MVNSQGNPQVPTGGSAAVDAGPAASTKGSEDVSDEQRIEDSLKVLKEMHIQLRGLRTTIPRLIAPLTTKQPSPEALFREFSTTAGTANQEVHQFRRLMNSEDSVKVMEQARISRADNPNDIKPWKVTDHPDWIKRDTK